MTLHVHRAERSDALVAGLAALLREPLADVFAQEVIAVPARGIERWLTQQLSRSLGAAAGESDGVCAGVRFLSPAALLSEVTGTPDPDPWAPDSLVWPLLEVIDECAGEAWCESLGTHLGVQGHPDDNGVRRARRFTVARRLAGLFDGYVTNRPSLLAEWRAGHDTDGFGARLPDDLQWQAELWRRLSTRVGEPDPALRRAAAADRLRSDPSCVGLPDRVSLFGPTRLPAGHLGVLSALAAHRDVHLWLPHPSPELWARLPRTGAVRRRADATADLVQNPLLSALGRDSRELPLALSGVEHVSEHHPLEAGPPTLLGVLQRDIRHDAPPAQVSVDEHDRSVQIHACHGPGRQVEVLREVIVGLLAADPTLEPRDVLVMCPDIEVYAPLVAAAFGLADVAENGHPAHRLRVRLADRALHQTNPLMAVAARLLALADGRATASEVLDLAAAAPVRRRFGFDDEDLEQLTDWVVDAGVRWGFDVAHRARYGLDRAAQNTWRFGLDRLLVGVAMADEGQQHLGSALPVDDVGSSDVELAGRLAEFVERLHHTLGGFAAEQSLADWIEALIEGVERLTAVREADRWQVAQLRGELRGVVEAAGERADRLRLGLADVRALLAGRLAGRPTRANFRTGSLTVCTMVPMRSVPHRVVCLVGMDDGVFPRNARIDGDDVLARDPAIGERDPRAEDRQLMLDAILAATEHLVITYTGADDRTGATRPPAVPLGELLDAIELTAGRDVRDRLLVRHPLQPYDKRTVTPGALGVEGPFTFDPSALAGAKAAAGPRVLPPPFLGEPLPAVEPGPLRLADVAALLQQPAAEFLRQRLDVGVRFDRDEVSDALAVELDALQKWGIGERVLRQRLAGADADAVKRIERLRGMLPPGYLGITALQALAHDVDPLVVGTADMRETPARSVDVTVELDDGRVLTATVPGVHGECLIAVEYSRLSPKHRLRNWISLVALTVGRPDEVWGAAAVGRGRFAPMVSTMAPLDRDLARRVLHELVDLYDRGLREPLPLCTKAGEAYAVARRRGDGVPEATAQARLEWESRNDFPGEGADAAHEQVWGARTPFEVLAAIAPLPDERWRGEPSRFGELAMHLWTPLLEHEKKVQL